MWAAFSIFLYVVTYLFGIQYDTRGLPQVLWWVSQIFLLPAWIVSEAMHSVGMSTTYRHGYVITIFGLSIALSFPILFQMLNKRFDDD